MDQNSIKKPKRRVSRPQADTRIGLRVPSEALGRIDDAARETDVSRSKFLLDSASERANQILLDTVLIRMGDDKLDALTEILDNPPEPTPELVALLARKAPWE